MVVLHILLLESHWNYNLEALVVAWVAKVLDYSHFVSWMAECLTKKHNEVLNYLLEN